MTSVETKSKSSEITIQEGIDFILSHLEEPIWPRKVSSLTTQERQILVYNKEEALARFRGADLLFGSKVYWNSIRKHQKALAKL